MAERSTVPCRVDFRTLPAQSLTEETGRLESVLATGCTILTAHHPASDATLELRIYLPDGEWPLRVDRAQMTAGNGDSFTVKFLSLPIRDQQRLRTYLTADQTLMNA